MGFSEMLWGAEKLVPAKYWCPYGSCIAYFCFEDAIDHEFTTDQAIKLSCRNVVLNYYTAHLHY